MKKGVMKVSLLIVVSFLKIIPKKVPNIISIQLQSTVGKVFWLLTENGERVAIERFKDIRFSEIFTHRIVKLDSSVRSEIPVGTILGYLTRGVNPNTCFIWLYKHKLTGAILYAPKRFSARLTSDLNGILFSGNSAKKLEDLFDPRSGFIKLYPKQISEDSENREIRYL